MTNFADYINPIDNSVINEDQSVFVCVRKYSIFYARKRKTDFQILKPFLIIGNVSFHHNSPLLELFLKKEKIPFMIFDNEQEFISTLEKI